jgi:hypothetical protein
MDRPTYALLLPFGIALAVVAIAAKAFAHGNNSHVIPSAKRGNLRDERDWSWTT